MTEKSAEIDAVAVRLVPWHDPSAEALRAAQQVEIAERYGEDTEPGVKPTADDIAAFFVAFDATGTGVGCGGLRELDETHAEIKRMFVDPGFRGSGVALAVLSTIEVYGRERGWSRLVLETGEAQPDAMRFYEREGYRRIPNFGAYAGHPLSVCYEKQL